MWKLEIKEDKVEKARNLAKDISQSLLALFNDYSSDSIERTLIRLVGVDGENEGKAPYPNVVVDELKKKNRLDDGILYWFANAVLHTGKTPMELAKKISDGEMDMFALPPADDDKIREKGNELVRWGFEKIDRSAEKRKELMEKYPNDNSPLLYVIVATGNIYEDVPQAKAAVGEGADMVAVIRSTAQSLLDYVPYGPTREGFGGTYATQENFRIMRAGLDEMIEKEKRYFYLINYASGLCMPEIAVMAAFERLDVLLNDALYGILFRDINPKRTLLDQYFSRMINAYANIMINTGEDNYLTTSDAMDKAYTVTASQLINEQFALISGLSEKMMGLGHAFEINPELENSFLYEVSHAMLARHLFPHAPLKYMPPTKHMTGEIYRTFLVNSMFNLAGKITGQSIQLLGMLTEAIHTPFLQDRYLAIKNARYVMNAASGFHEQFDLKKDSLINKRANSVLDQAMDFMEKVKEIGLFQALARGEFAEIKRPEHKGKGLEGVFKKSYRYINPALTHMKKKLNLN